MRTVSMLWGNVRGVNEAPKDGKRYVRKNGDWVEELNEVSETPIGAVNEINADFTLSQNYVLSTLRIYVNGQRLKINLDYTVTAGVISFAIAPFTGDILIADYKPS